MQCPLARWQVTTVQLPVYLLLLLCMLLIHACTASKLSFVVVHEDGNM